MAPLLLLNAVTAAGDIFHNIHTAMTERAAKTSGAQAAAAAGTFPAMLEKAAPVPTAAEVAATEKTLTSQLFRSTEVASAINQSGASGPMQLQIEASGSAALRLADGSLKPLNFSPELKATAQHLYQLQSPAATSAPAATSRPLLVAQA